MSAVCDTAFLAKSVREESVWDVLNRNLFFVKDAVKKSEAKTSDKLDLYYAANAASPTWVFIGTLTPTASGVVTLSTSFVLPSGSLQAIRGTFRYAGSAGSCTVGAYDDHDDLIFAVQ